MPSKIVSLAFTVLLLFVSIAFEQCRAGSQKQGENSSLDATIKSRIGNDFVIDFNKSKSYALCYQKAGDDHSQRTFQFIVVRLSDNRIVNEGTFRMGYVKWVDEGTIEVLNTPRVNSEGTISKTKITGNEN
jgi:hypothetical protein